MKNHTKFMCVFFALVLALSTVFASAAMNKGVSSADEDVVSITAVRGGEESEDIVETYYEVGNKTGNFEYGGKYYVDYTTIDEARVAAHELAVEIANEGFTLLKNADGALPLGAKEKKVTLFGIRTQRMIRSGFGSGAGGGSAISNLLGDALVADGFTVNPKTLALYNKEISQMIEDAVYEIPVSKYGKSYVSTYRSYNDAAIVVISRTGGENWDLATNNVVGHADENEHALQLDDNERDLIAHVKQYFDKVIVIINSSNIMQIPELDEEKTDDNLGVDAILWVGGIGQDGATAIASILSGEVNPSGHTADLWEKDFTKSPVWTNFGKNSQNIEDGKRSDSFYYDSEGNATNFASVEYREGIYSGYKFYETLWEDEGDYSNVLYPFGYGLSYTEFEWELDNVKDEAVIDAANQTVTMRVKVTNVGDVAGKDVVQIYYTAPYTKGGIEKAAANLVGFAKTKLLQPGESDVVTVQFVAQDMASFDWNDANENDFCGYELEAGDYIISARHNSHDVELTVTRTIEEDILCTTDYVTGKEIKPVYTGSFSSVNDTLLANMISRADGLKQPAAMTLADRTLDDETYADYLTQAEYYSYMDKETDPWYVTKLPASWDQETDNTAEIVIPLSEMAGVPYTEPYINEDGEVILADDEDSQKWEAFMNQFTWLELCRMPATPDVTIERLAPITATSRGTSMSYGYSYGDPDGPINAGGVQFPSNPIVTATFNIDLAYELGRIEGSLLVLNGSRGWRGSGADIHRSPFSGRNFEYFSEDGVMAGLIGAAVTRGVTEKGVIAHFKHFYGNDQESFRADYGGVFTWATEQTLREITAKPFEYIIKFGGTLGLMTSFNRIGKWTQTTNWATHEALLNQEWDFQGSTESDAWAKQFVPANLMVRGGDDSLLTSDSSFPLCALERGNWDAEAKCVRVAANADEYKGYNAGEGTMLSPTHYFAVRKCAQRLLQTLANSVANNNGFNLKEGVTVNYTLKKGIYNAIQLSIPGESDDTVFTFAAVTEKNEAGEDVPVNVWPSGMTYNANTGILSGVPNGEKLDPVSGLAKVDTWINNVPVTFEFDLVSDFLLNDENIKEDTSVTIEAGKAYEAVLTMEALRYGKQLRIQNNSNQRIMNAYNAEDGAWYHRDEDKSAADIITLGDLGINWEQSRIYSMDVEGLPEGLTVEKIMTEEPGWFGGSYEVNTSLKISGTTSAKGTYEVTVKLHCPHLSKGTNPWMRANGTTLREFEQKFTIVVE
ncbi:MAG: glycoside hydrolase family 3 protein [Lachnospiraceae bacterium]|nr:glycoside hydrolase family 3 protein [Lachnospiraceae bacterium]